MICVICEKEFHSYEFMNDEKVRQEGLIVCDECLRMLLKARRGLLRDEIARLDNRIDWLEDKTK
jgi:DNA-directed RNA polymerase subunit RPC12/RpoP